MTSAELVWRNAKTNFNGKVVKGMNEKFLEVGDVMQDKQQVRRLRQRQVQKLYRLRHLLLHMKRRR